MKLQVTAFTTAALALSIGAAFAQPAPAAKPAATPATADARPDRMASPNLAPHPPRLTVTPVDQLPLKNLKVPPGFKVELYASGMPGARMMTRGSNGTIFMGSRIIGRVYAITENAGKRDVKVIAEKLTQPNGVLFVNGSLYVAAINRVLRYDFIESALANGSALTPVDMTETFKLPPEVHHGWKFLALGPDSKIYVPVGVPCNQCEVNYALHGNIRRYNLDGSGMEIVARGVRNSVGFDFHPSTGELWFTDNGRDWMSEDGPQDELNRLPANQIGGHFGNPYCHANNIPDADIKVPGACVGKIAPVALMGSHTAALGMRFYTGSMFPAQYQNVAFIARRGSWNKTQKNGYDVVTVHATPDGRNAVMKPFMTGFLDSKENKFIGRPVDVLQMPDGSMLVADEENGAVYRVSYGK